MNKRFAAGTAAVLTARTQKSESPLPRDREAGGFFCLFLTQFPDFGKIWQQKLVGSDDKDGKTSWNRRAAGSCRCWQFLLCISSIPVRKKSILRSSRAIP